jgi:hypothetical protein
MLDGLITLIDERGMEWDDKRLGRHLKLRNLNVLLTVARCGSMGKAAAELALSQPAISKTIRTASTTGHDCRSTVAGRSLEGAL